MKYITLSILFGLSALYPHNEVNNGTDYWHLDRKIGTYHMHRNKKDSTIKNEKEFTFDKKIAYAKKGKKDSYYLK